MIDKYFSKFVIIIFTTQLFGCSLAYESAPGWERNETNTGLRGNYSNLTEINVTDVGYIDAGGLLRIDKNNITISDKRIPYNIIVPASGVVIERCLFQPTDCGLGMPLIMAAETSDSPGISHVIFKDCEMDFSNIPLEKVYMSIGVSIKGEIYRCNIYGSSTGISILNTGSDKPSIAEGNYIHGLRYREPAHVDGLTIRNSSGTGGIIIKNNYILVECTATGALFMQALQGPIYNVIIEGNLIQGFGNCIGLEYNANGYDNIQAINNRIDPWTISGAGPWYGYHSGGSGWTVWIDNYSYNERDTDCKGKIIPEL